MANLAANFKTKNDTTRLGGAQETYALQKAQLDHQRTMVSDAVARGEMTPQQGSEQAKALNMQQANDLQPILDAYKELANNDQNLAAKEKVIELGTQIAELRNPIDEVAAHMREQWDGAFEGLFENLDRGKKEWKSFSKEIQKMVLQDSFKQFIDPSLQAGLGQVFKNGGNGIPFSGGNKKTSNIGSQLAAQAIPGIGSMMNKSGVASGAGGGITVQIINQTSAPAQATATSSGQSQGADITEMIRPSVIQIVLENMEHAGPIGQALSGLGGMLA